MTTEIKDARRDIIAGAIKAADVVCSTMGVGKCTVAISAPESMPYPSPDGAIIARNIKLSDRNERIGSDWLLQQAMRTAKEAGDGTTTTCALVSGILKGLDLNKPRRQVVDELNDAGQVAIEMVKSLTQKISEKSELERVATISANNDGKIGKMISDLVWELGEHGTIYVKDSDEHEITSEQKKGYVLRPGLMSEHFLSGYGPSGSSWANPLVCLIDDIIYDQKTLVPVYTRFAEQFGTGEHATRSLVIFARDINGDALNAAVATFARNRTPIILVRVPGAYRLDQFEDLAAITGAEIWSDTLGRPIDKFPRKGINKFTDGFGEAQKVSFDRDQVTVFFEETDATKEYVSGIMEKSHEGEREELRKERVSKLQNGVGYIHIGGSANSQITNNGQLIDDSQSAAFNALRHGYLPGGGTTLLKISEKLPDTYGGKLLKDAMLSCFETMLKNSDYRWGLFSGPKKYYRPGFVFNMKTGQFEPEEETNVLDASKAVECAIRNAVAAACEIIKTKLSLIWTPEK